MKKISFLLAIVLSAALALVSFTTRTDGYKVGDTATDFSLKNIDGKTVSLADYKKAKGYIVIFTCNHCPYAKMYEDRIVALHAKYAETGYPVVAINPNDSSREPEDSFENMQKRAQDKGFKFAYLLDETQEIANKFGATKTPHVFLLDKNRVVKYIGAIDNNPKEADKADTKYLENAIDALKAGIEIKETSTKAVGCTIKWKNM
jgi:peroxiredoxin